MDTNKNSVKILKTRELTVIEGGYKKPALVIELSDDSRWYTTKGGHVAFNTFDKIVSGTNIDRLSDCDSFSFYGFGEECGSIDTMSVFVELVKDN